MTNQPEHNLDMVREQSRGQMREFVGYLLRWYESRTVRTVRQTKGKQPRAVRVSRRRKPITNHYAMSQPQAREMDEALDRIWGK